MGKSFIEERKFPIKMEKLSSLIKSVSFSKALNIKFLSEKALCAGVRYEFKHGFSLKSWGEKIVIKLTKIDENNVTVLELDKPRTLRYGTKS